MEQRWQLLLHHLRKTVSPENFEALVRPMRCVKYEEDSLVIGVPSQQFVNLLRDTINREFSTALLAVYGRGIKVNMTIAVDNPNAGAGQASLSSTPTAAAPLYNPQQRPVSPELNSYLQSEYTFDTFVAGASNRVPLRVVHSFLEHPEQQTFSPFFLFGPSGVGKTHLVTAVGHAYKKIFPEARVLFVASREFQSQYQSAVQAGKTNDFIHFYQTIDMLILDDFQEIRTPGTLTTFFHIINHLQVNRRKILITSDRPPADFEGLEERMLSRLKWDIVCEIERPDLQLRRDILMAKVNSVGLTLSKEVLDYIADNVSDNVREIQGAVNSMLASAVNRTGEIDLQLAKIVVARLVNQRAKEMSFDHILTQVCQFCKVKPTDIRSTSRRKEHVLARQLTMYMCQKYTKISLSQLGRNLGGRDHSTVNHGCTKIARRLTTDKDFRTAIEGFELTLKK